jgi:hypothetical protein
MATISTPGPESGIQVFQGPGQPRERRPLLLFLEALERKAVQVPLAFLRPNFHPAGISPMVLERFSVSAASGPRLGSSLLSVAGGWALSRLGQGEGLQFRDTCRALSVGRKPQAPCSIYPNTHEEHTVHHSWPQ